MEVGMAQTLRPDCLCLSLLICLCDLSKLLIVSVPQFIPLSPLIGTIAAPTLSIVEKVNKLLHAGAKERPNVSCCLEFDVSASTAVNE